MSDIQTLLCAIDLTSGSAPALTLAADLAERMRADLHLVHVSPRYRSRLAPDPEDDPERAARLQVETFVNEAFGAPDAVEVLVPTVHVRHGEAPADGILRAADEAGADVIVTGTHGGRGLEHLLLGSVAAEVLRRSPVPTLVVPRSSEWSSPGRTHPVVVAVDFSPATRASVQAGARLARAFGTGLELAHVLDDTTPSARDLGGLMTVSDLGLAPDATDKRILHHALLHLIGEIEDLEEPVERHVKTGTPATALVRLAWARSAGAIVLGTHGRQGLDRLRLGSVAEWVIRRAPCPVWVEPMPREHPASTERTAVGAETAGPSGDPTR